MILICNQRSGSLALSGFSPPSSLSRVHIPWMGMPCENPQTASDKAKGRPDLGRADLISFPLQPSSAVLLPEPEKNLSGVSWGSRVYFHFHDPADVGNLISGSSASSKTSFTVHILLKPSLENFEHYFTRVWDECNCVVVWAFFGIAFLWDWNEN